jgi:hypothetical protein
MRFRNSAYKSPLWLWLPPIILAVSLALNVLDKDMYSRWISSEQGLVEVGTLVLLATAVVYGFRIVLMQASDPIPTWIRWWVLLITLGSIYFLGEEASWGQHLFGWRPSDDWNDLNLQAETNLHNINNFGFLFDQMPRNALTAAAVIGGIVVPLYQRFRSLEWRPNQFCYWFWPTFVCTPAALVAVFVSIPHKVYKSTGAPLPDLLMGMPPGEFKEFFLAFFIMLYMVSLAARISRLKQASPSSGIRC